MKAIERTEHFRQAGDIAQFVRVEENEVDRPETGSQAFANRLDGLEARLQRAAQAAAEVDPEGATNLQGTRSELGKLQKLLRELGKDE